MATGGEVFVTVCGLGEDANGVPEVVFMCLLLSVGRPTCRVKTSQGVLPLFFGGGTMDMEAL